LRKAAARLLIWEDDRLTEREPGKKNYRKITVRDRNSLDAGAGLCLNCERRRKREFFFFETRRKRELERKKESSREAYPVWSKRFVCLRVNLPYKQIL
jgi:hypothetical protein